MHNSPLSAKELRGKYGQVDPKGSGSAGSSGVTWKSTVPKGKYGQTPLSGKAHFTQAGGKKGGTTMSSPPTDSYSKKGIR